MTDGLDALWEGLGEIVAAAPLPLAAALVGWLQDEHPEALPRFRAELGGGAEEERKADGAAG